MGLTREQVKSIVEGGLAEHRAGRPAECQECTVLRATIDALMDEMRRWHKPVFAGVPREHLMEHALSNRGWRELMDRAFGETP